MKHIIFFLIIYLISVNFLYAKSTKKRFYYIFENSYQLEVKLGPVAKVLHYGLETGLIIPKAYFAYQLTGDPFSTAAFTAYELVKTPPVITAQSYADLQIRYYLKRKKDISAIAKIPHLKTIKVFSTAKTEYQYALAVKQKKKGLIFLETDQPISDKDLPIELKKLNLGKIIEMQNLEKSKIELFLEIDGKRKGITWSPSLQKIFDGENFPAKVTAKWKKEIDHVIKEKRSVDKIEQGKIREFISHLTKGHENIKIKAILRSSNGDKIPLGIVAEGKAAIKLVEQSLWKKIKAYFQSKSRQIKPKKFPLNTTKVIKSKFSNCLIKSIQNLIPKKTFY